MIAELAALLLIADPVPVPVPRPEVAPPGCAERERLVAHLAGKFQETVTARGVAGDGVAMLEIFTSPKGTWTIVVTGVQGVICMLASGEDWLPVEKLPDVTVVRPEVGL